MKRFISKQPEFPFIIGSALQVKYGISQFIDTFFLGGNCFVRNFGSCTFLQGEEPLSRPALAGQSFVRLAFCFDAGFYRKAAQLARNLPRSMMHLSEIGYHTLGC